MSRRSLCFLPAVLAFCLLAPCLMDVVPALGAAGGKAAGGKAEAGKTRVVPIPGSGLALRVPRGIPVLQDDADPPDDAGLRVEVDDLRTFEEDGVIGRADVLAQRDALAKGEAEVADGWEEGGLSEVVALPTGGNAVLYPWYSPFEYCAMEFTMNAAFFVNNRRVILRYSVSPEAITRENPGYFQQGDPGNDCDADTIWKQPGEEADAAAADDAAADDDILKRFHEAVKARRLGPVANAWYADFRAMLASLHRVRPAK